MAGPRIHAGVFVVSMATLAFEILLTRIFSVTMWYHFAFVAISVAMFGMTAGALAVHRFGAFFAPERTARHMAGSAAAFALSIPLAFLTHLSIPFFVERSIVSAFSIFLNYAVLSVPFAFVGICICLALTRYPSQVGGLYGADLAGAALGCFAVIGLLKVTDGPAAVIAVSAMAGIGAVLFAPAGDQAARRAAWGAALLLGASAIAIGAAAHAGRPLLRLVWVKGEREPPALTTRWNSFSRIQVRGDPAREFPATGWGMSANAPADLVVRRLGLRIDAGAFTELTHYAGDLSAVRHLAYDVTNVGHVLVDGGRVLVVGVGGGRDILSALAFGQREVVGVELNEEIVRTVNGIYGDFTGHLDRDPRVTFVNDEARSWLARTPGRFDMIQISMIDTWAATASGAFVLSEQGLYTVEAWRILLDRLADGGVLSVSRYYAPTYPFEMYRLTSLAAASLGSAGIADPSRHLVLVCRPTDVPWGIGTMLVKRTPFTEEDLDRIDAACERLAFEVVLGPRGGGDPALAALAAGPVPPSRLPGLPVNVTPPTDDAPFFFNMLPLEKVFDPEVRRQFRQNGFNANAVTILGVLLLTVVVLTAACVFVPLARIPAHARGAGAVPLLAYFAALGIGFMLLEIAQMQRLIVFLGHPTYGLTVVLSTLLVSSGIGSLGTRRMGEGDRWVRSGRIRLGALVAVVVLGGLLTVPALERAQAMSMAGKCLLAAGLIAPMGWTMGAAFPIGMRLAAERAPGLAPWLWGVNGATSVLASVLAIAVSMHAGISASYWAGCAAYGVAFVSFSLAQRVTFR